MPLYINTVKKAPYIIEGINVKSEGNSFYFEDFVCDENGEEYNVVNCKNKKVGSIKLSKKAEIYNQEKYY